MPFLLPLLFTAVTTTAFVCAALTFAITANVPAFRHNAIPAPLIAFILSPALFFVAIPVALSQFFLIQSSHSIWNWILYGLIALGVTLVLLLIAWFAVMVCRAVFELLPQWLHSALRLRIGLLLQATILLGGSLSLLVLLVFFAWLTFVLHANPGLASIIALLGLVSSAACLRALFRLPAPQQFQPAPLPAWIHHILFHPHNSPPDSPSSGN